jgi:NAD(P)H-hydrate epimerase
LILCGSGNNGGDGFALARMLTHLPHVAVRVVWIGAEDKMSEETAMNFRAAAKHGIPLQHLALAEDVDALNLHADCLIDALVGVGGNEHPRGILAALLEKLAQVKLTQISPRPFSVAIDIPTGLNAETGKAHKHCFRADLTITMAALKTGLLLNDVIGRGKHGICGEIVVVPIGIPDRHIAQTARIFSLQAADVRVLLPPRNPRSTKHHYGSVAVIGGTSGMSGAPALAANASISAGAGLVRLYAPSIHAATLPEVMTTCLPATETGGIAEKARNLLSEAIEQNTVFVIGPGLGREAESLGVVRWLLESVPPEKPIVLDADGLRSVRKNEGESREYMPLRRNIICTPHRGEFARLTDENYETIPERAQEFAPKWALQLGCTLLLKNVPTIITDGTTSYWNTSGNAGLATAGSGDVLAGIIGAMLAQGVEPLQAAALGAYLHSAAGDSYAAQYSEETLTASRIITSLQESLFKTVTPENM